MKRIVLLRHGESTWNKDNRFTGWTDVDLTEKGIADANQADTLLKEKGFHFDKAYTSFLKRAVKTLNCVLDKRLDTCREKLASKRKTLWRIARIKQKRNSF